MSLAWRPVAVKARHFDATCVRDREKLAQKDWTLVKYILANDYTVYRERKRFPSLVCGYGNSCGPYLFQCCRS